LTYNDHNAPQVRPKLLQRLRHGDRLALVSDAGTPLISDPGHKLVREAREAGIPVFPIPGASAAIAALSAAGLPTDRFFFAGFLPSKSGERRTALSSYRAVPATLVFYESPNRLADSLADMAAIYGAREAAVARELTKLHEEIRTGTLEALAGHYGENPPRGEITILVAQSQEPQSAVDPARVDSLLRAALSFMPAGAAASLVAEATGESRRNVYARALALRNDPDEADA
jgi:16S rRNA (cytidine1402-2'-O)-methyltransferase